MGKKLTKAQLIVMADEYGALCAEKAKLDARMEVYKSAFIDSGQTAINGNLFRVTVSTYIKSTLVAELVRNLLKPKQILACTRETPTTTVKCKALVSEG